MIDETIVAVGGMNVGVAGAAQATTSNRAISSAIKRKDISSIAFSFESTRRITWNCVRYLSLVN